MTEVATAEALILKHMPQFASHHVALSECVDRVLAQDVIAERDQPPFDRVTMDGIALAYRDWAAGVRELAVVGTQAAGMPALAVGRAGQCVEVMTGAMLPKGTDTVIPVERVDVRDGTARVSAGATVNERQFVHARGSDRASGSVVLTVGSRIGAPELAVLANAGLRTVAVAKLPRIAVISTGDELVGVDEPIEPYQIRSTNDRAIEASLVRHRLATVTRSWLADDLDAIEAAIAKLDADSDVLILSGGVSMGQFDFVPAALERLGAKLVFQGVRQRPGRPMWFGISASRKPIFALPGNPVSTLVCTTRYILPALRAAAGLAADAKELVALEAPGEASPELTHYLPIKLGWSAAGTTLAAPRPTNTSGDFTALAGTDGFVELPPRSGAHPAGTVARLFRW